MSGETYAVVLVYSTSHAVRIEKLLTEKGVACKLIPVPRQISSNCGVCVRIARGHKVAAQEEVAAAGIENQGIMDI